MSQGNVIDVKVRRLRDDAVLPYYATSGAAGLDLVACLDNKLVLQPSERSLVPTGIAISLPDRNWVALVFARSGLATRSGVALANGVGVIDADYRGEIMCALMNLGDSPVTIEPGDRIAQIAFMPVAVGRLIEVAQLDATERGQGGFGSTGYSAMPTVPEDASNSF